MAYVRARGRQVLIVRGERDAASGKVTQRILFTIYSRAEAAEALADLEKGGGRFGSLLRSSHPGVSFDWKRIGRDLEALEHVLPEKHDIHGERVGSRFREGLRAFARQLMQANPQELMTSADLIQEHRGQLAFLADLIAWRTKLCDQQEDQWNADTPFYWRFESAARQFPLDVEEMATAHWEKRDLERAEPAFRLMVDCFDGYAEGHNYLGLIALERGQFDAAIASFEKTMELGRRLFPSRISRKSWWSDHRTRPYMRGMQNLALSLNRAGRWDEALATCDRLEQECDDRITAMAHRSSVYMNIGRWPEAVGAALYLHRIDPGASLVAALALFEVGRRREALCHFLHGAFNGPRSARLLLGMRYPGPRSHDEAEDHNTGVYLRRDLHAYLGRRPRASLRFFADVAARSDVAALLTEVETVMQRWHVQHPTGEREAFDRMNVMRSVEFARERATEVANALDLQADVPAVAKARRRRSATPPGPAIH